MFRQSRVLKKWYVSQVLVDRGSRFQARATQLSSLDEVDKLLAEHAVEEAARLKKASHTQIHAYRVREDSLEQVMEGSRDCGERGGGARLLELLRRTQQVGVLLVVTRWAGSSPLGGARFRHISSVGADALEQLRRDTMTK